MPAAADVRALSHGQRTAVRAWYLASAGGLLLLVAHLGAGLGGRGLDHLADTWLDDLLELLAGGGCLLRAAMVRRERVAWLVLGLAIASFGTGDLLFDFAYGGNPPTPSAADGFYLAFYPGCYAALLLILRSRVAAFHRGVALLDGLSAALASAALAAAVVFELVYENTHGRELTVVVDLAYPLGDVLLLGLAIFAFAVTGWRPGRAWAQLGAGFVAITVADSIYMVLNAEGSYREGTLLDALWPTSLFLLATAAWQQSEGRQRVDLEGRFLGAVPIGCGFVALGVLIDDHLGHLNLLAISLAAATIATVLARTAFSVAENSRLLHTTRAQSLTDALTGLGNRRKLTADLEQHLAQPEPEPRMLVILDLNGFKGYNDRFGHPSGDALLARLAAKLAHAFAGRGGAYRLGGDEFCVLTPYSGDEAGGLIDAAVGALAEEGEGFAIAAAFGAAVLPDEATSASDALRVADERLYAQKAGIYRTAEQSYEVLMRAVSEREPRLADHVRNVAELAVAIGTRLGLGEEPLRELRLAAELHDVGKLAIPDTILQKRGPLDRQEWEFIRRHTMIGQRILAGAPALRHTGAVVRSTHERWDGRGYPDGLAGSAIPAAARIIAVADAYAAMTSDRPYRPAVDPADALGELRACAGTQFDPGVVAEFCALMSESPPALPARVGA